MNEEEIEKKIKTRTLFPVLDDIEKIREAIKTLNPDLRNTFFEKEDSTGEFIYFSYKFFSSHTFPGKSKKKKKKFISKRSFESNFTKIIRILLFIERM